MTATYSRDNPSRRYLELLDLYRAMHERGEVFLGFAAEKTFPGMTPAPLAAQVKRLIEVTGALTLLDYGSGKGKQYDERPFTDQAGRKWPSLVEYWNLEEVVCYDPCYAPYNQLPAERFDGVICTDVFEHLPEEDIGWIVDEIFSRAGRFVFANVACYAALKRLPNGENAHCTVRPAEWWTAVIDGTARRYPGVAWEVQMRSLKSGPDGEEVLDQVIGSAGR